jgi:thiamine-phosphate pyrophosphorylase
MTPLPFRLLAVTPPTGPVAADSVDRWLAAGAAAVGVAVLLREPGRRAPELLADDGRLAPLRRRCRERGVPVLLGTSPGELAGLSAFPRDLAGVQLARDPGPAALTAAREQLARLVGAAASARLWLGRSCHGEPQPGADCVDYTVVAPVFTPGTTDPTHPLGPKRPAGLTLLARWCAIPDAVMFALGGVTPATARACLAAGAHGLAGISVVFGDPARVEQDVAALCRQLADARPHVEPLPPR